MSHAVPGLNRKENLGNFKTLFQKYLKERTAHTYKVADQLAAGNESALGNR